MSILSVNALGSPNARLSRSRSAPVASVAIEERHSSAKSSPGFN